MLPLAAIPIAEIVVSIVSAIVIHKVTPKKINIDIKFD